MPAGRPKTHTPEEIEELKEKFSKYIEETEIPVVAEFAYKNDIARQTLYDYEEFSTLLKKCIDKKEAQLEILGRAKKIDSSLAIFSLKQLGWSDKQHLEMTGRDGGPVEISRTSDLSEEEKEELIKAAAELIQKK